MTYAALCGFSVLLVQEYIRCNRYGSVRVKHNEKNNHEDTTTYNPCDFINGPLKAGCTFSIQMKSSIRSKKMPNLVTSVSKPKYRNNFSENVIVKITKACCDHGGLCQPCTQQLIMTRCHSGQYVSNINQTAFFTLCNIMKHNNGILRTSTIKNIIFPLWPTNKNLTKHDVSNI